MNAIEFLERQHEDLEQRFGQPYRTLDPMQKRQWFQQLADRLAIHSAVEEKIFYPEVKRSDTEQILLSSLEEHLVLKRTLADLLTLPAGDPSFDPKLDLLHDELRRHVGDERNQLFPKVRTLIGEVALESIGSRMAELEQALDGRAPRLAALGRALQSSLLEKSGAALLPSLVRFVSRVWAFGANVGIALAEMVRPKRRRPA